MRCPPSRPPDERVPHASSRPLEPDCGLGGVDARKQRDDRGLGVPARGGERCGCGYLIDAGRVTSIRDFRYVPYITTEAAYEPADP